jgi:hypothetical protein
MKARILLLATLEFILSGCATAPRDRPAFDPPPETAKITLLPVGVPPRVEVSVIHSTGVTLGLVGTLVDGVRFNAHEKALAACLEQERFDFHATIARGVESALKDDGYRIDEISGSPASIDRANWLRPLPEIKDPDYVLDVVFDYFGYAADWDSEPYLPSVAMKAQLTDRSGKQIFFTRIIYNPALAVFQKFDGPRIPADTEYAFGSMGDLKTDPAKAKRGLEIAVGSVLDELRRELDTKAAPAVVKSN